MLTFSLKLLGEGTLLARIADRRASETLVASYLFDAVSALTDATLALLQLSTERRCSWVDEKGEYRWILRKLGADVEVTITWIDGAIAMKASSRGNLVFSGRGNLLAFAQDLREQLRQLLEEHGLEGYREKWMYDFPLRNYEKLGRLLAAQTRPGEAAE